MTPLEMWAEIQNRFEPNEPVPLNRQDWFATRTYDPIESIQRLLSLPIKDPAQLCFLYLGTIGTGKSSELRRLAREQGKRDFVVVLDLIDHFERVVGNAALIQHITAWEVCFLTGLVLYEAARERWAIEFPENTLKDLESAWRAAAQDTDSPAVTAKLDLAKLAKTIFSLAATAVAGPVAGVATDKTFDFVDGTFSALSADWNLPIGNAKKPLSSNSPASRRLLVSVNNIIATIQKKHQRVVLIIDGLDRIHEADRIREVFIDTDILTRLFCPLVVCGPFRLRHDAQVQQVRVFSNNNNIHTHANEPVLLQNNPKQNGNGVAFFYELYKKRVSDIKAEGAIPYDLLMKLAYYSGGRARDFVRLVRVLAIEAMLLCTQSTKDIPAPKIATPELVDRSIDMVRRQLEIGLHAGHLRVLQSVIDDPQHRLPNEPLTEELLLNAWLLPFPNRSEWFYPHPLLLLQQLQSFPSATPSPSVGS